MSSSISPKKSRKICPARWLTSSFDHNKRNSTSGREGGADSPVAQDPFPLSHPTQVTCRLKTTAPYPISGPAPGSTNTTHNTSNMKQTQHLGTATHTTKAREIILMIDNTTLRLAMRTGPEAPAEIARGEGTTVATAESIPGTTAANIDTHTSNKN